MAALQPSYQHPPPPHAYGHVPPPPHHHHPYPPLLPPPHQQHPQDMDMAHSHPYPPPELQHHHQSHPYSQSAGDMAHPYTSPYPVLPPPQVPARNGGVGTGGNPNRKRKKADSPDDQQQQQPPARRLRRLHEACTRCRTKKIKCDSKLPSCSACTAAHVECNQEDRHRQTLKPRGYTDKLEVSLVKCVMVLQRLVPGFEEAPDVDALFERQNLSLVDVDVNAVIAGILAAASGMGSGASGAGPLTGLTAMKQEPHPNALSMSVEASGSGAGSGSVEMINSPVRMREVEQPRDSRTHVQSPVVPASSSNPLALRSTSSSGPDTGNKSSSPANPEESSDVKGQDPQSNDLSGLPGLIKAFGVSRHIVRDLPRPESNEGEDVLGGVRMEDDDPIPRYPKLVSQWTARQVLRRANVPSPPALTTVATAHTLGPHPGSSSSPSSHVQNPRKLAFRLPRNRSLTERVVKKYFESLNAHRPIFIPEEFESALKMTYESLESASASASGSGSTSERTTWGPGMNPPASVPIHPQDDPGFLCSVYLILALGRLSEDNDHMYSGKPGVPESLKDYPTHEEFFELALAVKPDLRVTISSLQALILLQWYLYTERHGRTLWRLVGNLVRLSIELGLHHDPSEQGPTFTPAECEVRNRLWWTVLIHDRGTSVLLGRPLAIADADFNTPFPRRHSPHFAPNLTSGFTEHFEHSPHLTSIQGDIINALYRPGNHKQTADQVVRHASRITKGFGAFSRGILGERYRAFFEGTENWTTEQRMNLVMGMNEDQGLTLLKYGIARILLLRALFTSSIIGPDARRRALKDAVITSHNILTIQMQLTSFPSLAFFVSPIPIHIAAMVIIYGIISKCDALPYARAREDICSALHIVPLFRWRWNRKDSHGSHPLIVSLAKKVFGADVLSVAGPLGPPILIPEWDWTTGMMSEPSLMSPSRDGMGLSHNQPAANGHASSSSSSHYHHDSIQASPVSAVGGSGQWDQGSQQLVPHSAGGHSRQNSGMVPNGGSAAGNSPQIQHAGAHPPREQYSGHSHPAHNGSVSGPPAHDSASSSSSGPQQPQPGVHYSPTSDGTPPSYQINDTDKNWMEALLYPPPLTSEQSMQGMATSGQMSGVGAEQNGAMATPHHIQPSHPGQQPVQHGVRGYDVTHPQQQQQITTQHAAHSSQQLPPHHQAPPHSHQMHHGVHHQAVPQHPHQGHNLYSGPLPAQPSTALIGDYSQSGAYYLQEEFDQSVPIDGLAIPAQNGMWTS
ncbi:hypothetical protein FRB96_009324 [Tulasnella sp. 330]|nr:hypothetical protein FRB96_009324 [Tulasnella sp. 330]KAG8887606.1 hypothetical protein FRB98_009334 [Tulasnella sp. 332]